MSTHGNGSDPEVRATPLARRMASVHGVYRDGRFELHEHVNVGIAVAAADALVVATDR